MNKISEKRIRTTIKELKNTKANSLVEASKINNHSKHYYSSVIADAKKHYNGTDLLNELLEVTSNFNQCCKVNQDIETDDRAVTEVERDENGCIQYYTFEIFRKNNPTLSGKLSRSEMETIYRLYSIYGANLTQKIVSREFPQYTFVEFKRILRAFNIYKSDSEFPLHMLEEKTEEQLETLHIKAKENNLLRKLEKNELRDTKKLLEKLYKENQELKEQSGIWEFKVTNDVIPVYSDEYVDSNNDLVLYLSDLHIGATLESGALIDMKWDEEELERRLKEVVDKICSIGRLNNLIICIMGDSLDGMDGMTARKDHVMPQNMDNRKQVDVFMNQMIKFVGMCIGLANNIKIYAVPSGNHDGDFGYVAHRMLGYAVNLKFPDVEYTLFDKFFGHFTFKDHNFLVCHGKDSKFMKKPLPVHLNDKTSDWIKDFIIDEGISTRNLHVVKGDLHTEAYDDCRQFDYRNVLSLFGSSDYSLYNYRRNNYGVSYDLFIGNNLVRGTFQDF